MVGHGLRWEWSVCQLSSCVTWRRDVIAPRPGGCPHGGVGTSARLRVDLRVKYRKAHGVSGVFQSTVNAGHRFMVTVVAAASTDGQKGQQTQGTQM